jgi:hypothetical protein
MKLTKENINTIISLFKKGKSVRSIAEKFNLSVSTVRYHINPEVKRKIKERSTRYWKSKSEQEKKKLYLKRVDYQRKYHAKRYKENIEFREKQKQRSKNYNEINKKKNKTRT